MPKIKKLDIVSNYLYNPLATGVQYLRFSIETESIRKLLDPLSKIVRETRKDERFRFEMEHVRSKTLKGFFEEYFKILESLPRPSRKEIFENHKSIFLWSSFLTGKSLPTGSLSDFLFEFRIMRLFKDVEIKVFGPNIPLIEIKDALNIFEHNYGKTIIIDVVSLKDEGLNKFSLFIKGIPHIGESYHKVLKRKEYASRLVYNVFPAAILTWIKLKPTVEYLPKYILDFFEATVRYFEKNEWRTSIVLSAIIVESTLAEIYEEEFHKPAPDTPLGNLKQEITKKVNIPKDIVEAIDMTNDARIAAVHRSRRQVSNEEALQALQGSVKFIIWYYFLSK